MEALQRLAAEQSALSLLSRHSLSSLDASHDHFLAKFLLFAAHNSHDAEDMLCKCSFLANTLQKASPLADVARDLFYGHASADVCKPNKAAGFVGDGIGNRQRNISDELVSITLKDMERAKSTLEDFCRSYFMFHNLSTQNVRDIFEYIPVLAFVESYIYQIDEHKEEQLCRLDEESQSKDERNSGTTSSIFDKPAANPFKSLQSILKDKKIWNHRIEQELQSGRKYWTLEQSLCEALLKGQEISIVDVMEAAKLKSFDYRVLNLLLYEMLDQPVKELHMEFLSISELLVEISDDLFDYEEDVLKNSFNILRMYLKIYGPTRAPGMLAQLITKTEDEYKERLGKLETSLAIQYQKRCEEATIEGGGQYSSEHPFGVWTMPPLILDEGKYRECARYP